MTKQDRCKQTIDLEEYLDVKKDPYEDHLTINDLLITALEVGEQDIDRTIYLLNQAKNILKLIKEDKA